MVLIKNEQEYPVDVNALQRNAKIILDTLDYPDFDLGILLATPEVMQNYNREYRQKDKATDVLSFPYHEILPGERIEAVTDEEKNLGDMVICPSFVADDLERWGQTFQERMQVLLVHGVCHLLGYDHIKDDDYEVMKLKEEVLLQKIRNA